MRGTVYSKRGPNSTGGLGKQKLAHITRAHPTPFQRNVKPGSASRGRLGGLLGAALGRLGTTLGPSGGPLAPSWGWFKNKNLLGKPG